MRPSIWLKKKQETKGYEIRSILLHPSGFTPHKTEEKYFTSIYQRAVFQLQPPRSSDVSPSVFYPWGDTNINSSACSCNSKWRDSSLKRSWRLSNHAQTRRDISESATAHNVTCLDVHWFSWRMFCVSVVNCGLIKNRDTTAVKLGMFAVNVLSLLYVKLYLVNPLNAELNPICYLLALLGAHHFLHDGRIRVKSLTLRLLISYIYIYIYIYIYGAPILDVSRSHTTTHHSR